jgi:hypothetical protein
MCFPTQWKEVLWIVWFCKVIMRLARSGDSGDRKLVVVRNVKGFWSMTAVRNHESSIEPFVSSFNLYILTIRFIVILVVPVEKFIASLKCMTRFNVYEMKSYVAMSLLYFVRSRRLRSTSSFLFLTPAAHVKWIPFIKIISVICLKWCKAVLFCTVDNVGVISRTLRISDRILNLWPPWMYKVFQKYLYNFESLYKFIQRTCTVFWTVIMQQNTPRFTWDSYGSVLLSLVMQGFSKRSLQWYSKYYYEARVTKTFTLQGV